LEIPVPETPKKSTLFNKIMAIMIPDVSLREVLVFQAAVVLSLPFLRVWAESYEPSHPHIGQGTEWFLVPSSHLLRMEGIPGSLLRAAFAGAAALLLVSLYGFAKSLYIRWRDKPERKEIEPQ